MFSTISKPLQYILTFALSAGISYLFMPQIYRIARNVRAIDDPAASERKIHKKKIPRLGGLAIYIGFLLAYTIIGKIMLKANYSTAGVMVFAEQMESILIASFFIVLMGIFDDISPITAWKKFAIQIIAATIVVFRGNFVVDHFNFLINIHFPVGVAQIFTILWIVTITNAINLSDGLDGLAGGISFISLMTMAIVGMLDRNIYASVMVVMVCLLLAGSIFGFLPYNLPPAKIFMGDSGAQFIGFMIGTLSVFGYKQAAFTSFVIPVTILALPIFDTIFAFLRRAFKRLPASAADANHIHHRVFHSTASSRQSLFWIYGMSALFSTSAIVYSYDKTIGGIVFILTLIIADLFLEHFHVIGVRYQPIMGIYRRVFYSEEQQKQYQVKMLRTLRYQKQQQQNVQAEQLRLKEQKKLNKAKKPRKRG